MAKLWFNTNGILHDGIGLVLCDTCPCVESSSVFSDSGSASGSSSICLPGCAQWEAQFDENIDPFEEYDRVFTITIDVDKQIICPGDQFTVTVTYSGGTTPVYAQVLISDVTYTLDSYTTVLSPVPPYGLQGGTPYSINYGPDDTGRTFEFTLTAPVGSCVPLTITAGSPEDRDTQTVRKLICC